MAQATFSPEGLTLCWHVHLARACPALSGTAARVKYLAACWRVFDCYGFWGLDLMKMGDLGEFWFLLGTEGCAGCGQEPPPLIGAALLPSAG